MEVFKVSTQDKVCSALLSRSLTFLVVEVFKICSLILQFGPAVPSAVSRGEPGQRFFFFALFAPARKRCGGRRAVGWEGARALELIRAQLSSSGSAVHGGSPMRFVHFEFADCCWGCQWDGILTQQAFHAWWRIVDRP